MSLVSNNPSFSKLESDLQALEIYLKSKDSLILGDIVPDSQCMRPIIVTVYRSSQIRLVRNVDKFI